MNIDKMTIFLAIWGAALGTIGTIISVILAVREFRKDQRHLVIHTSLTKENPFWLAGGSEDRVIDNSLPNYIVVHIYNNGFRPIQIKSIHLKMLAGGIIKDSKFIKEIPPISLAENESVDAYFDIGDFFSVVTASKDYLNRVIITDSTGKQWNARIPKSITSEILAST